MGKSSISMGHGFYGYVSHNQGSSNWALPIFFLSDGGGVQLQVLTAENVTWYDMMMFYYIILYDTM